LQPTPPTMRTSCDPQWAMARSAIVIYKLVEFHNFNLPYVLQLTDGKGKPDLALFIQVLDDAILSAYAFPCWIIQVAEGIIQSVAVYNKKGYKCNMRNCTTFVLALIFPHYILVYSCYPTVFSTYNIYYFNNNNNNNAYLRI
jgi:hypothetical protein